MLRKILGLLLFVCIAAAQDQQKKENLHPWSTWWFSKLTGQNIAFHARAGNTEGVRWFINNGADINNDLCDGFNALDWASSRGHLPVVEVLIKAGANINCKHKKGGGTALMFAAHFGHEKIVNVLIKAGADTEIQDLKNQTAAMYAAKSGHALIVDLLINAGADTEIQDATGSTALMLAASCRQLNAVNALINQTKNKAKYLEPYISILAVQNIILAYLFDINKKDNDGFTALNHALGGFDYAQVSIVDTLLKSGADVNVQNLFDTTPFMSTACRGYVSTLKYFLRHKDQLKIDLNKRNHDKPVTISSLLLTASNLNALGLAYHKGRATCVKLLLVEPGIELTDILAAIEDTKTFIRPDNDRMGRVIINEFGGHNQRLFQTLEKNDLKALKDFLKQHKDLRVYDAQWENPLHKAFRVGLSDNLTNEQFSANVAIITLILSYQSCLLFEENRKGETPFYIVFLANTPDSFAKVNLRAVLWQLIKKDSKPVRSISANGKYVVDARKKIN